MCHCRKRSGKHSISSISLFFVNRFALLTSYPLRFCLSYLTRCHHPINHLNDKDSMEQRWEVFAKVRDYSKKRCL